MKRITVFTILAIILVDANNQTNDNEVTRKPNNQNNTQDSSSSEERRWQPFFPKNIQKFVVTMNPTKTQRNSTVYVKPAKTLMVFKIAPTIVSIKNESYWEKSTTRQPLMKYTKFTVSPLTTFKLRARSTISNKRHKDRYSKKNWTALFRKVMDSPKKEDSSEEVSESPASKGKDSSNNDEHVKKIKSPLIYKIRSRHSNIKPVSKFQVTSKKLPKETNVSSEEKEDRKEFIFVTPKQMKENAVVVKDSDESNEDTTVVIEHKAKESRKQKRSVNVIEEENLGTTVSGFKFTGKINSLSSDLVFRNINT